MNNNETKDKMKQTMELGTITPPTEAGAMTPDRTRASTAMTSTIQTETSNFVSNPSMSEIPLNEGTHRRVFSSPSNRIQSHNNTPGLNMHHRVLSLSSMNSMGSTPNGPIDSIRYQKRAMTNPVMMDMNITEGALPTTFNYDDDDNDTDNDEDLYNSPSDNDNNNDMYITRGGPDDFENNNNDENNDDDEKEDIYETGSNEQIITPMTPMNPLIDYNTRNGDNGEIKGKKSVNIKFNICKECGERKNENKGNYDKDDGKWYCNECWKQYQ